MSDRASLTPNPEYLKKQSKALLRAHRQCQPEALARIGGQHPRLSDFAVADVAAAEFSLQDAQLVVARENGYSSWPNLMAALVFAGNDSAGKRVLAQARATDSARGIPEVLNALFEEMVGVGVLLPESGVCFLMLIDEQNGWFRPQALRRHPRHWGITCSAGHLTDMGDDVFVLRATRPFSEAPERLGDTLERWREGKPWWRQEKETDEGVIGLLMNDYGADKVTPEFVKAYSGERWWVSIPIAQGIFGWIDVRFSEEFVDLVQGLVAELSRGLPQVGGLQGDLG